MAMTYHRDGVATLARTTRPLATPDDAMPGGAGERVRRWRQVIGPVHPGAVRLGLPYGLRSDAARFASGSGVLFRAYARTEGDHGVGDLIAEARLLSAEAGSTPGWRIIEVDLGPYTGRKVELLFEARETGRGPGALTYAFWARPPVVTPPPPGPSVILVSLDTLRADRVGCYGYQERSTTPHLDRIARTGTRFALTVAPSPWTTPSHMSLFTGLYPTVHAVDAPIESKQRRLAPGRVILAELMRQRGYRTAAFTGAGAISAVFGFWRGFDLYDETPTGAGGREGEDLPVIYPRALRWLEANRERPFFLFLHTYEIHSPYTHAEYLEPGRAYSAEERRVRLYDGGIAFADRYLGRLVRDLARLGLSDSTLLLILSDHGEELQERYSTDRCYYHGHHLFDDLLLVPLVMSGPGIASGRVVTDQVSLIDVMPTLLALTGIPLPDDQPMQGISLVPHLDPAGAPAPGAGPGHPFTFAEAVTRGPERKGVRTRNHKLVWMPSPDQTGRSPIRTPIPPLELFDLVADPKETRNIESSRPELARDLKHRLEDWWARSRLLRQQVPEEEAEVEESTREVLRALGYIR
jgi:arylsulfatase A-like enzyme